MVICSRLFQLPHEAVEASRSAGAPLGEVVFEMGYLMSQRPSWLRPDISVEYPNQPGDLYCEGSPMVVFEIVSPGDRAAVLERRVEEFLACGKEVWVIYPETRHAMVHESAGRAVRRKDAAIRSSHLPRVEIPFDRFL